MKRALYLLTIILFLGINCEIVSPNYPCELNIIAEEKDVCGEVTICDQLVTSGYLCFCNGWCMCSVMNEDREVMMMMGPGLCETTRDKRTQMIEETWQAMEKL